MRMRVRVQPLAAVALASVLTLSAGRAQAAASASTPWPLGGCPTPQPVQAVEIDAFLHWTIQIQNDLRAQGVALALISRSGLNLGAIGHRYSHAGWLRPPGSADGPKGAVESDVSPPDTPWSVRQLYYDCQVRLPRVFDEGLAGFVRGVAADTLPRLSVVWWPQDPAAQADVQAIADAVADDALATALVGAAYQAQAHVWSLHTQNCNQWLVEMMAAGLSRRRDRAGAQEWLRAAGYAGSRIQLPWVGWLVAADLLPHMGLRHHPPSDLQALQFEVAMPASIERFVQHRWPGAQRLQWCLRGHEVVVRRSWSEWDDTCSSEPGDEIRPLMRP